MRLFTDVLEEYLQERDRQNSEFYDNLYIGARTMGREHMSNLADELNAMVQTASHYKDE